MSKDMLVKVEAQYPISGGAPILVSGGGGDRARTRREKGGRFVGGLAGGLGAIAGKHRSLGSLLQSIVSGYAQGKDLGGSAGKFFGGVSPEAQIRAQQREANRMAQAKKVAVERYGGFNEDGDFAKPVAVEDRQYDPYKFRPIMRTLRQGKDLGVEGAKSFANRFKRTPAEEVAVTPEGRQLPAQAGVIGPDFQLNAPPSEVAVESPYSMGRAPLLLGPGDWTEEEIPDDPRIGAEVAVKPERFVSTELPGSLGDFAIPKNKRVRVERPAPRPSTATSRESMFGGQTYVNHPSRTELPAYDKRETPLSVPEQEEEEHMKRYFETANLQAANVAQAESDATLQANAAKVTANMTPTKLQSMQPTLYGAGAENQADEQMGQQVIAQTGLDDDPDLAGTNPADGVTPMSPAGGGPPANVNLERNKMFTGVPLTSQQQGKVKQKVDNLGIGPDTLVEQAYGAGQKVELSEDRLPVVGIRKARTRRVLVV